MPQAISQHVQQYPLQVAFWWLSVSPTDATANSPVSSTAFTMNSLPVSFSSIRIDGFLPTSLSLEVPQREASSLLASIHSFLPVNPNPPTVNHLWARKPSELPCHLVGCNHILPTEVGFLTLCRRALSQVWVLPSSLRVFFSIYPPLVANYLYMVNNCLFQIFPVLIIVWFLLPVWTLIWVGKLDLLKII